MKNINDITNAIIGASIKVHSQTGPGLLESAKRECLYYELRKEGFKVEKEKSMPLKYDGLELECEYRVDLMVEDSIIVELKAVKRIEDVHLAQLLTYLKMANCKIGLLLNFNEQLMKEGIRRVINKNYKVC